MFRQLLVKESSLINLSILNELFNKQLILLYLKFQSNNINFETFSSQYRITYDSYKSILKSLENQQIVKEVNKNNSRFKTHKLIKPNIQIFPHASKVEENLIYQALHSPVTLPPNPYIQIILNPHALQLLKQIKKKYKSKPFQKSSIVGNNSLTKSKTFKFLIDNNAITKIPPKTYILTEFHDQAIQQAKLKKNRPILNSADLNSIIKDTKWEKYCNTHNLEISATFEGLYNDSLYSDELNPQKFNILSSNNNNQEGRNIIEKSIQDTQVTLRVYPDDKTMITIKCSQNPIYVNNLLRLDKILAEIIEIINKDPYVTKVYDYDYHNFTVIKHDFALDGTLPYRLKKGSLIKDPPYSYKNTDGQDIIPYVKKNYKSSNTSWVRFEIRADNTKYSIYNFRKMVLDSKLNICPSQ